MVSLVDIISLGCSKNLVDSERLLAQLKANNIPFTHDADYQDGDTVVINTCGFIGDAKEESIETILRFADRKNHKKLKRIYVMGCLSERHREELVEQIPEVDKFYGKFDWMGIIEDLGGTYFKDLKDDRCLTTPQHYAYLKISEGCNRMCSYCAIPLITGRHKSRPMEEILAEAEKLAQEGVVELQVIAQDLSSYGLDLYHESRLSVLVNSLSAIDGIKWIRLHYAYPAGFPMDVLDVMAQNPKVCKYIDLALQHISDKMLGLMRRRITKQQTLDLIAEIRRKVPGIHIRTTLITGHPGETEEDFQELADFVRQMRFERLGVFPYSHETDTYAWKNYKDDVPDDVKQQRADTIMELQSEISMELNTAKVGSVMPVIADRREGSLFFGRTQFDSPEVDQEVSFGGNAEIGKICSVRITGSDCYDLRGEIDN